MKIVQWGENADPVIVLADGENLIIEDTPYWDNLEVGDMIQHVSQGFGTSCYFVTEVVPANPEVYTRGSKLVTIKGAISR